MNKFPKFKDVKSITSIEAIDEEIFLFQKLLFDLKITAGKKTTSENSEKETTDFNFDGGKKPHYFLFLKRRLTHLKYQKSILLKQQSKN